MAWLVTVLFLGALVAILSQRLPQLRHGPRWLGILAGVLVVLVALVASTVKVIPAGHVGVKVLFGRVQPDVLPEGLHLVNPLVTIVKMSVRTQEIFEHAEVPSKEGLNVILEASLLYHVDPTQAARLYRQVGPQYERVVLIPIFRSAIRGVTVQHDAKDLYTSGREVIANEIAQSLEKQISDRGLVLEQVLLRRIQLPKLVEEAINEKLAAEQQAQRMQFVLMKEAQEAERKRIEAKGIQDFQNIVSQGISEPLLRWKGIEATKTLAESQNTKVIIIGGRDGLPLILNTDNRP